jgi:Mg-chelatase subunit ChlD
MEEKNVLKEAKSGNGITELVFILDKSGSMAGMEDDTVKGFNSMIREQKDGEGTVLVSTVLFSNRSLVLHDRVDISTVLPLTERDYRVGGSTALLDAIGDAVKHIKLIHKYIRPEDIPERTMFIITTDGAENSSRKYSSDDVKAMIKECEKNGWEFLFVADNIDAVETAASIGIREDRAAQYSVQSATPTMFREMSETLSCYRKTGSVRADWSEKIDSKK